MSSQFRSVMAGAALAACLILPATAADNGWLSVPSKSYAASSLKIDHLVGNLKIDVRDGGGMSVDMRGEKARVNDTSVSASGGVLTIEGSNDDSVWNWRNWFNFTDMTRDGSDKLFVHVTVPRGSDVRVDEMIGDATIGDTMGVLHFGAVASNSTIGKTREAHISLAGSGKVTLADTQGLLKISVAGSGRVMAGSAKSVHASTAGAGRIAVNNVSDGVHLDIAGSGDLTANQVNGPVHIGIAGAGNVRIAGGEANPLHVSIIGSGHVDFGGTAVDPHISAIGSGNVRMKAYRGNLHNDGADVTVGDKHVESGGKHHGDDDDDDD